MVNVLFAKLLLDRNGSSPRMSQLWVKKSQVLEFSQTNWLYSLKEYILENAEKLWFGCHIEIFSFFVFYHFFFLTFFKIKNCWFICILGAPKWSIKNGFGHIFRGFWVGASTQPFGPVPGPKSKNKCWYLKG